VTGTEHQALLREAALALAKYDDDQKKADEARNKADEARKKADEDKTRAEAATKSAPPVPPPAQTAAVAPPVPPPQGAARGPGADGLWHGTYRCSPNKNAGDFNISLQIHLFGGTGTWVRPGSGPGTQGNQSLTLTIRGNTVLIARNYVPQNNPGVINTAQMNAQYDGANTISGGGPEHYSGGRTCQISLTR
jgi:hypothetical protein